MKGICEIIGINKMDKMNGMRAMTGVKIKICGLFRPCDAEYVNLAMPDYAGFVFYEKSRRKVTPEQAHKMREVMNSWIKTVGVFVNAPIQEIAELYRENIVDIVQLHGDEGEAWLAELRGVLPDVPIWKAYRIRSAEDIGTAAQSMADMVLLDNGNGTGKSFDWSLIRDFPRQFLLAGGLTPENIPIAVARLHPYAVDLSSGVESGGRKDRDKILAAVAAARRS